MEFDSYNFPEFSLIKLISPLTNTFKVKTPKLSINRTLKGLRILKEDGITESESEKISIIYTPEEQNNKNNYNMNLYKNNPPLNTLVYTDNENDPDELKVLGQSINYDYLVKLLQSDTSNIENFIDENNGIFLDKKNETPPHINFKKLNFIPEPKNEKEAKIIFDSKFESGNLRMAIKLNSEIGNEYDLIIRKDFNYEKNYSWFFFSIESDRETDIKLNLLNFTKKKIMFDEKEKIRILVYNKNDKWTRNTYNVQYYQNNIKIFPPTEETEKNESNDIEQNINNFMNDKFKEDEKNNDIFKIFSKEKDKDKGDKEDNPDNEFFFTLSFCYHVNKSNINTPIYFALCFPYTYSSLQEYLYKLSLLKTNRYKLKFSTLNKTICGNPLDILYITNFASPPNIINSRQSIIFTARVHPGETSGSYVIESVINNLLNNSEQSNTLLNKFVFKIIPMLNPDGVIHGHYRNNILGKDLNRMWQDPRENVTPTIYYLKKLISINKPFFFCDFHGHSNMPNCALYCCSPPKKKKNKFFNLPNSNMKSYHFYEEKVFMRIFEEDAKYYQKSGEKYNIQKSKLKSARGVIYNEFNIYYSYALETGLMAKWSKQNIIINGNNNNPIVQLEPSTINEYYQIGTDFVNSLIKWNTKTKFYNVLKKIRDEEENKKNKDKDKDKDKDFNFIFSGKEIKNKRKYIKLSKMNSLKTKDINKEKGGLSKTDKMSEKKIKESMIINSMLIYPQLLQENLPKFEQIMPKDDNQIKKDK